MTTVNICEAPNTKERYRRIEEYLTRYRSKKTELDIQLLPIVNKDNNKRTIDITAISCLHGPGLPMTLPLEEVCKFILATPDFLTIQDQISAFT